MHELHPVGGMLWSTVVLGIMPFVLVLTGAVSRNMRDAVYRTYEAIPEPRLVIVMGACAINGGPFRDSPEVENGVPRDLPVDLWIPGCPPHPLTVLDGLLRLIGRLEGKGLESKV